MVTVYSPFNPELHLTHHLSLWASFDFHVIMSLNSTRFRVVRRIYFDVGVSFKHSHDTYHCCICVSIQALVAFIVVILNLICVCFLCCEFVKITESIIQKRHENLKVNQAFIHTLCFHTLTKDKQWTDCVVCRIHSGMMLERTRPSLPLCCFVMACFSCQIIFIRP